ncbi:MAG: ATPase, T2SS/T4P/T4SS family [Planctomycetaceae bacterium]
MIFRRDDDDDEDEDEIELVQFKGSLEGRQADLKANAKLARMGLIPAKELVTNALSRRAEKLVIEPKGEKGSLVRLFIDGIPYSGGKLSKQHGLIITQMLKLLAGLDVQERRRPQSGGIKAELEDIPYEILVDSRPLGGGFERLILRSRNLKQPRDTAETIGITPELKAKIRGLTADKRGLLMACGPPDSGVSTTALGIMRSIDAFMFTVFDLGGLRGRKILNVTEFERDPKDDFETVLGRLVRVEADVVFLEPLEDPAAARTVLEWQKKLVLISEIKAKDAAHAIVQLVQWAGDPALVADGLKAAISPKLVRVLCTECRQAFRPNPKILAKTGLPKTTKVLYRAPKPGELLDENEEEVICERCGGVGFLGRAPIFQVIEMTPGMKQVVAAGANSTAIRQQADKEKMQTFRGDGLRAVADGVTSLEELQRVFREK